METDELEEPQPTYQPPRVLVRQRRLPSDVGLGERRPRQDQAVKTPTTTATAAATTTTTGWLNRLGAPLRAQQTLRTRLADQMARLSSLDSTRSSSSLEAEQQPQQQVAAVVPPTISISQPAASLRRPMTPDDERDEEDEEDDEDDDGFGPVYGFRSATGRGSPADEEEEEQEEDEEDPLDDRQGMNRSEQQFTKGEQVGRPSLDGSISSELRQAGLGGGGSQCSGGGGKRGEAAGGGGGGGGSGKRSRGRSARRSKSPSASSGAGRGSRRGHARRGLLGLAGRLKLTRKHESIAKLQLSILNSGLVSLAKKSMDRDLQSFLPRERLAPKELERRVKLMRRYEVLATIEYRFASRCETYVSKHAGLEPNQPKNNYRKCVPYDYNRVVLRTLPGVAHSDYINASHVDSYLKPNAYIAAQGPNEHTVEDFWRMVWEQRSFVVVMLTKVFDFIRVMCNQYWPVELNKPERYGQLEVTLLYEEPLADFVIRTIRLTKLRRKRAARPDSGGGVEAAAKTDLTSGSGCDAAEGDTEAASDDSEGSVSSAGAPATAAAPVRAPKYRRRRRGEEPEPAQTEALHKLQLLRPPPASTTTRPAELEMGSSPPGTPLSQPRTPSSAGLDRSSATRKAVKKKRRARAKQSRPARTQFLVPSANQLSDDDSELDSADEDPASAELEEAELGVGGLLQEEPGPETEPESPLPVDSQPELAASGAGGRRQQPARRNERIVYQFHYNSWASHTCPFINSLLHFRRRVRICMDEMAKSGRAGPTVVHCNDGCGRTGTYLAIDANLELAEEDGVYDVFNYTKKMRQSRKFLIESLEQYRFVYETLEEAMVCGKTWFPVAELHQRLKHKSQRNPKTKKNEYQREYEKICRMAGRFSIGDCAGGHRVENREKNRDVSTVPPDNFRPYLSSFQSNDNTDYINAVFVDGYTRSKEYIVTEWPLHRTISDFWSLVYDHDCNSVILLANPGESSQYPSFLPSEKELKRRFGPVFSAEMVSYTHYQNIKSWIYSINKKIVSLTEVIAGVKSEAKTTQVFQLTCWPQGHRVPTSTNALVELMNMVERWRQRTAYGPVCVVSLNGKSRAGVYCAANVAIEQVVQHSEVDVFQAVKTVRRHRPQLIENMTEYKYCYDLILHYVLHYVNQPGPG